MLKKNILAGLCVFALHGVWAGEIDITGTQTQWIHASPSSQPTIRSSRSMALTQPIALMSVKVSSQGIKNLFARESISSESVGTQVDAGLPRSKQLGMNHVPVLDQGAHGSCVLFAVTGILDAALYRADEISQLCQLELGTYLSKVGKTPSGWDGSIGHIVLNQIEQFGYMTKTQQRSLGCGGLTEYPRDSEEIPDVQMKLDEFSALAQDKRFISFPLLHINEAFSMPIDTQRILIKVKKAIQSGDRVMFSSLLVDPDQGVAGAVGQYHQPNDTWILTTALRQNMGSDDHLAAHAMIITGYDDDVILEDSEGLKHKGLLTLRNSWGPDAGDRGNYYMSYDYFTSLVMEAHQVRSQFISQ